MSKANNAIKVLRTALKRVGKGWMQNQWSWRNSEEGITYVCLEGAVYGYCAAHEHVVTEAQTKAIQVLRRIIFERHGKTDIPEFNDDPTRSKEEVLEVIKLAIIRLETSTADDDVDEELTDFVQPNGS